MITPPPRPLPAEAHLLAVDEAVRKLPDGLAVIERRVEWPQDSACTGLPRHALSGRKEARRWPRQQGQASQRAAILSPRPHDGVGFEFELS